MKKEKSEVFISIDGTKHFTEKNCRKYDVEKSVKDFCEKLSKIIGYEIGSQQQRNVSSLVVTYNEEIDSVINQLKQVKKYAKELKKYIERHNPTNKRTLKDPLSDLSIFEKAKQS